MINLKNNIPLQNYLAYLIFLEQKFQNFFEKQKEYVFCKRGCGKCCKNAEFPYTAIEVQYLILGYEQLPEDLQKVIYNNIEEVKKQKKEFKGEAFHYTCPFLINNECAVYNYRGLVCRTFGLMVNGSEGESVKVPFCAYEGLNYSNVMDLETHRISKDKFKDGHFKNEPSSFNISYKFLTDKDFERGFNFRFGDKKPLIDWFMEDKPQTEKSDTI